MAWALGWNSNPNDKPYLKLLDGGEATMVAMRKLVEAQFADRERGDPFSILTDSVMMIGGFPFPAPEPPFRIRLMNPRKRLPDILQTRSVGYLITQRVIDLIEAIEPGVHRYYPQALLLPNMEPFPVAYFALNIRNRVDAIAFEACEGVFATRFPFGSTDGEILSYRHIEWPTAKVVVHQRRVEGMAIWWDYKLHNIVISDRLKIDFDINMLKGWSFTELGALTYINEI